MTGAFIFIIPALAFVSAFLFAISLVPQKSALTIQLDALKARQAKRDPKTNALFDQVFQGERRSMLMRQLAEAGWYTVTPAQFAMRIASGAIFGIAIALLIWRFVPAAPIWIFLLAILVAFAGAYAPIFSLNKAAQDRKVSVQKGLPDFLDMVASTVQAGLALNAAMAYAVDVAPGALGEEVKEALSEIRLGRARAEALKGAAERTNQPDFKNAVRIITQAERLGANVAKVLAELADDARHHRLMIVEEMAAKLPVKMVFPMAFCMLPAIFIIIFGTVGANYLATKNNP